jgi:hypothetical protein
VLIRWIAILLQVTENHPLQSIRKTKGEKENILKEDKMRGVFLE